MVLWPKGFYIKNKEVELQGITGSKNMTCYMPSTPLRYPWLRDIVILDIFM